MHFSVQCNCIYVLDSLGGNAKTVMVATIVSFLIACYSALFVATQMSFSTHSLGSGRLQL